MRISKLLAVAACANIMALCIVLSEASAGQLPGRPADFGVIRDLRAHAYGNCAEGVACQYNYSCITDRTTGLCTTASAGQPCGSCSGLKHWTCQNDDPQFTCFETVVSNNCCVPPASCITTAVGCECVGGTLTITKGWRIFCTSSGTSGPPPPGNPN